MEYATDGHKRSNTQVHQSKSVRKIHGGVYSLGIDYALGTCYLLELDCSLYQSPSRRRSDLDRLRRRFGD